MIKKIVMITVLLGLSGCAYPVLATIGNDKDKDILRGTANPGYTGSGTIVMYNTRGTTCNGTYHYYNADLSINIIPLGGLAAFRCTDGSTASVKFRSITRSSGWGAGETNKGKKINFTYGMSDEEARMYLNLPETGLEEGGQANSKINSAKSESVAIQELGLGTGFVISESGHILTNNHVVSGCEYMQVRYVDGTQEKADVLFTDVINDLAVIKVNKKQTHIATLPSTTNYRVGEDIVTFGFGLGYTLSTSGIVTTGTIGALSGMDDDSRFIQITASIQHGNSGGPLSDNKGNIIGINTAGIEPVNYYKNHGVFPEAANFSVKEIVIKTFLKAHGIPYTEINRTQVMSNADIGEMMKNFSVKASCFGYPKKSTSN
jgi:S1-C subfamily serine protease